MNDAAKALKIQLIYQSAQDAISLLQKKRLAIIGNFFKKTDEDRIDQIKKQIGIV